MPNVGGKKFPYTKAGMMAAKRSAVGMEGGGRAMSDADRERVKDIMGRIPPVGKGLGEAGKNISDADRARLNQLLKIIIQRSAEEKQGKAEAGAVARGNVIAREEALENSDMDLGIVPQDMMYGGEAMKYGDGGKAMKRKVQKYRSGGEATKSNKKSRGVGCVMAGRGMKKTKMS